MLPRFSRWLALGLALMAGCASYAVREQANQAVGELAAQTMDLEPAALPPPRTHPTETSAVDATPIQPVEAREPAPGYLPPTNPIGQTEQKEQKDQPRYRPRPLEIPPDLPGANAEPFKYPEGKLTEEVKAEYQRKFFPPLPPLGPEPPPAAGPNGNPLTLSDLQRLARANNPDIKRAVHNVQATEGAAIQAGLHPNPNFGYAADTISNAATAGFQGVFFEHMIKTAGKLELARQAASVDVANARVALRATENDVATRVRSAYFAVLVAQENVRVSRALTVFTEEVYRAGLDLLKGGFAVPYEPIQLRSQVYQARSSLVAARNSYQTAWRQLAGAIGLPGMPATQLAGRIDVALPVYQFEEAKARVLARHTDVLTAQNDILRAQLNLRLARITPIPDIDVQLKLQKDYTAPPHLWATSIQATVPIPVFDRNQGNILQAEAQLASAEEEPHKARDDLYSRLADAFGRYETNRATIAYFRDHILPDQVRGYQGLFRRFQTDTIPQRAAQLPVPVVSDVPRFQDLVTAQQNLVTVIQSYLTTLNATWTAVVDVANLLQTDDLFQVSEREKVAPIPELCPLPCCHPASPLREPALYGADGGWPRTDPEETGKESKGAKQ
jgi:cobalt-zinc-cadmium efflux system outer membrane protein